MSDPTNISDMGESSANVIISDIVLTIYIWVVYSVLCQLVNMLGIVTNIINIVCFVKQGFNESINVSLLGLSVSDLASLVTMSVTSVFMAPAFSAADLPFECYDLSYLIASVPHFAFTRVSSCVTAMITLERCLSIAAPLKVKSIITPQRVTAIIVCIFIIFTCSSAPIYAVNRLGMKQSISRNKTVLGLVFHTNRDQVDKIALSINNFIIPVGAFLIIILCTVILSLQLHKHSKWRQSSVTQAQSDTVSDRNKKVAKMVLLISTLYIVCFVPTTTFMFAAAFEPNLFINGKYIRVTVIVCGFTFLMESINSSVNIFIYHNMSTKYRDTFRYIFCIRGTA